MSREVMNEQQIHEQAELAKARVTDVHTLLPCKQDLLAIAASELIKQLRAALAKPLTFPDFIRNATPAEKAAVYAQVMGAASRDQAATVDSVDDHVESELGRLIPDGESAPIPEGWQLVPVEPTLSMELAGKRSASIDEIIRNVEIYTAMLKAAPKPAEVE